MFELYARMSRFYPFCSFLLFLFFSFLKLYLEFFRFRILISNLMSIRYIMLSCHVWQTKIKTRLVIVNELSYGDTTLCRSNCVSALPPGGQGMCYFLYGACCFNFWWSPHDRITCLPTCTCRSDGKWDNTTNCCKGLFICHYQGLLLFYLTRQVLHLFDTCFLLYLPATR